jgi:hypothetical protein
MEHETTFTQKERDEFTFLNFIAYDIHVGNRPNFPAWLTLSDSEKQYLVRNAIDFANRTFISSLIVTKENALEYFQNKFGTPYLDQFNQWVARELEHKRERRGRYQANK